MELHQIRYALAAAKALNFTKAASDCNVSQPALTNAVRKLEEELGAPLFHREGRRILLSAFGQKILPHLQQIMAEAQVARDLAESYRLLDKEPVRLGVLATIGPVRLSRCLSRFEKTFPGVEVAVHEDALPKLLHSLEEGELDLAILNPADQPTDGIRTLPLYTERYVVILPPEYRLGERNSLSLADLSGEPYVDRLACEMREMVMRVCEQRQVSLYARFRSHREDWVQAMVVAGIDFAFMPEYSVTSPELMIRPLADPEISRTVCLASMPGRRHSPAVEAFVRSAQSFTWPG